MADVPEDVQRWTAKRRAALVLSIIRGETGEEQKSRSGSVATSPPATQTSAGTALRAHDRFAASAPASPRSGGQRAT